MRWITFFILAYIVLGVQLGAGPFLSIKGAAPNLVLIAAIFISGNAPRDPGLLGAFLLGLFQDLLTLQPPGLFALSYGLAGLLVMNSRQAAYGDHPLTHFMLTLGGGLITAAVLYLHAKIRPGSGAPIPDGSVAVAGVEYWPLILSAFYSALLALPILWFMRRTRPLFGFRTARQRW
jgi:rod shape-determining protein MreD